MENIGNTELYPPSHKPSPLSLGRAAEPSVFTELIATGICACLQSIGGFGCKAMTQFGKDCIVCVYISDYCECRSLAP